jgi:hypothetical protein
MEPEYVFGVGKPLDFELGVVLKDPNSSRTEDIYDSCMLYLLPGD